MSDGNYPLRPIDRQAAYGAAKALRRFSICDQTAPPASYTAQTSFVATTPFLILYKAATTQVDHILSNFELSQTGTVAAGAITVLVALENADRHNTGGTAIVPKNTNSAGVATAITGLTVKVNHTAAAAGSGLVYLKAYSCVAQVGNTIKLDCLDGVVLGPTSSVLIYVYAGTTAPTCFINGDVIEETNGA